MRSLILSILLILIVKVAQAQLYGGAFYIDWSTTKPLSDKDFNSQTNSSGLKLGYTKFQDDRFGWGVEALYTTLDDYRDRRTYVYDGGAITTDMYMYHYVFSLGLNAKYFIKPTEKLIPYVALGGGAFFSQYKLFYNVYVDEDSQIAFYTRPEAGVMYRFNTYKSFGLKASVNYDYAWNESEYFGIDNFSAINFQVGIVLFND